MHAARARASLIAELGCWLKPFQNIHPSQLATNLWMSGLGRSLYINLAHD